VSGTISVPESQPGLALVDDGDALRRRIDHAALQHAVGDMLHALSADGDADDLHDTPRRVARAYAQLLTPPAFGATTFPNDDGYEGLVVADAIPFNSLCMRHLLPFRGLARVGYLPGERIVGLSKLARVVERFRARPADLGAPDSADGRLAAGRTAAGRRARGRAHMHVAARRAATRRPDRTSALHGAITRTPYERLRLSKDYLRAARPDAGASTCTARASTPITTSCTQGRTAVDMNTTLQEIGPDVMPQQNNGIPVAEHPLERSAS
jgi:hypothetical protein